MRILHIIDTLGLGGAQTVVKGFFDYQLENNDIFLFALRRGKIITEIKHPNVTIYDSTSKYSLIPLLKLKKIIKEQKIGILHCHLFRSTIFGFILKVVWFPQLKLIVHVHSSILQYGQLYKSFINIFQKKIDVFIAVSFFIKEEIIKNTKVPAVKIVVIYNFVDLLNFSRDKITWNPIIERKTLGIYPDDFVVGFAGRIVDLKGWAEFIKAAALLVKEYSRMKFIIVGDGRQKAKMLTLIRRLGLEQSIIYLGYKSDMVWFYSILDCFVIPSHREAMGITELEALAMGVPVIASDIKGLNEVIINNWNGITFRVGDSIDLADKIKIMAGDQMLRTSLIKNATGDIKKYNLESYLNQLKIIYEL